ncbi:DUF4954 family protein [Microbacter margulisiae]|uniref:DUF4954 family protein n=1 Tax=Microbacter margulisiae TaxID=1350067 RepID=A0A7W5DUR6_9PORP|nr:DUF4954 family protein [Microbacter margulisiae]MBB3188563.1 hypothetical protein [Microbacter margulisiae]
MAFRSLTTEEIQKLQEQGCQADRWENIEVTEAFNPSFVQKVKFTGHNRLGTFQTEIEMPGGIIIHSGIYNAWLHNCIVEDNVLIHTIRDYIANYTIENHTIVFDIKLLAVEGETTFGNGIAVEAISESGARSVMMYDRLSAQIAYIFALYRHRPQLIAVLENLITQYSNNVRSSHGVVASGAKLLRCDTIINVKIGEAAHIEGVRLMRNGSVNSAEDDPVFIGDGCHLQNFIICAGTKVNNATLISNSFVGQGCIFDKHYSADQSLFFSNCQGLHGEACSIFAGPFTVTHHKSTLLIAGMFSFLNAGSGSNQSNHLYKLGPIHQGLVERGSKTGSDSYILWPAKVGAFTFISGRHYSHCDTSDLPFSYLIEHKDESYLSPAINLRSIGTIRDSQKWPHRDMRRGKDHLDCINYNLLSPYTVERMVRGRDLLLELREKDETCALYKHQGVVIEARILSRGIRLYENAIWKFLGNSLITQLEKSDMPLTPQEIQSCLAATEPEGSGKWVDIAGMICPIQPLNTLLDQIENDPEITLETIHQTFRKIHLNYYQYEWTWASDMLTRWTGKHPGKYMPQDVIDVVNKWLSAVLNIDKWLYEDAKKEFVLSKKIGFGTDGDEDDKEKDFENVRGTMQTNESVLAIRRHMQEKEALGTKILDKIFEANPELSGKIAD